jgi:hypothetical protein
MAYIYALRDPRVPGEVRYVGKTREVVSNARRADGQLAPKGALYRRWIESRKGGQRPVDIWFRELVAAGVYPKIEVLLECEHPDDHEDRIIEEHRTAGHPLLNRNRNTAQT